MPNIRGIAVPLDVYSPFKSGQICMSCSDIFGLEMLKLRIYVEPIASLLNSGCIRNTRKI
uniref:Pco072231b n=1 Tax=Arundo donax TaxID=35708 RepID=A0A0A9CFV3_ARUDO